MWTFFSLLVFVVAIGQYRQDITKGLMGQADAVVEGHVVQVYRARVLDDYEHVAEVTVEKMHKGVDHPRYVHYRRPLRPTREDQGQKMEARAGDRVLLFVTHDAALNKWTALEPLGVEVLEKQRSEL